MAQSLEGVEPSRIITQEKRINIIFPFDKSIIDSTYMDNAQNLSNLHHIMSDTASINRLDSIVITAHSSPEGSYAYNIRLAGRRADAIKAYILHKYPYIKPEAIKARPYADYWGGLIGALTHHPDAPGRNEFMKVVIDADLTDDDKVRRMMTIQGGSFFKYIRRNGILARLRQGSGAVQLYAPSWKMPHELPAVSKPKLGLNLPPPTHVTVGECPPPAPPRSLTYYPLALRTNLLLSVLGGPNLAIEVP